MAEGEGEGNATNPPPPRWEDLDQDILAEIFGRLDIVDLVQSVPFVCKPWMHATLLPRCWKTLNLRGTFSRLNGGIGFLPAETDVNFTITGFLKFLLSKSQGTTKHLLLRADGVGEYLEPEALSLLCYGFPELNCLALSWRDWAQQEEICAMVEKWPKLEALLTQSGPDETILDELLRRISINCEKFWCLHLHDMYVSWWLACAIVEYLPRLRRLDLCKVRIEKEAVVYLLKGLGHLNYFSARDCIGFVLDSEIAEAASSVRSFVCEGCELYDEDEEEEHEEPLEMEDVSEGNSDDGYYL